jgi:hypothetical protein
VKPHQSPRRQIVHPVAYRQAFERLDEALARTSDSSNAQRIQLLGQSIFGDSWDEPEEALPGTGTEADPHGA